MSTIRVLLADQHEAMEATINTTPSPKRPLELVGVARDGHEALRMVQITRPDVAVFAEKLPVLDGLSAASQLHLLQPDVGLVVVLESDNEELIEQITKSGAHMIVHRDKAGTDLIDAVLDVMEMLQQ